VYRNPSRHRNDMRLGNRMEDVFLTPSRAVALQVAAAVRNADSDPRVDCIDSITLVECDYTPPTKATFVTLREEIVVPRADAPMAEVRFAPRPEPPVAVKIKARRARRT